MKNDILDLKLGFVVALSYSIPSICLPIIIWSLAGDNTPGYVMYGGGYWRTAAQL